MQATTARCLLGGTGGRPSEGLAQAVFFAISSSVSHVELSVTDPGNAVVGRPARSQA
jgi:hypothetical protein